MLSAEVYKKLAEVKRKYRKRLATYGDAQPAAPMTVGLLRSQPYRQESEPEPRPRIAPPPPTPTPQSLAAQILAAGECARRGGHAVQPPKDSLAARIIAAAATARAGGPELARPTGLAAQIVEAGKWRRGEI